MRHLMINAKVRHSMFFLSGPLLVPMIARDTKSECTWGDKTVKTP